MLHLYLKKMSEHDDVERDIASEHSIVAYNKRTWTQVRRKMCQERLGAAPPIIIDCSYDGLMNRKDINSRNAQLCFCYGISKSDDIKNPLRLSIVGASDALLDYLLRVQKDGRWMADITGESLEALIKRGELDSSRLAYLSADADEKIETYASGCTYIIGGLVDRNHHKEVAYRRARDLNIRAVKLPLRKHPELKGSIVMAINHVYKLMTYLHDGVPFVLAIDLSIPQRKRVWCGVV